MRTIVARIIVLALGLSVLLFPASLRAAPPRASAAVAQVRYIAGGLGVQPPHRSFHAARERDPLYQQYGLRTPRSGRASISFHDGTVLHMDENTDVTITSHLAHVHHGRVAEYLQPGTNHKVATDTAVAGATGTTFLVSTQPNGSSAFIVLHGVVQVQNPAGTVVVRSNQETVVHPNQAPGRPQAVNAQAAFAWTDTIPTPDLGENLALDSNGGTIAGFSSEQTGYGGQWNADHINDGLLQTGWETQDGSVANQWVKIGLPGSAYSAANLFRISTVILDPAATAGDPSTVDLKDFEIRVSSTGTDDADFTTVLRGTCRQENTLQPFLLPAPALAKYVELYAIDNYGDPHRLAVAEIEIVANNVAFAYPDGISMDSAGDAYVADTFNDRIEKLSPTGQLLASWGSKGGSPGQFRTPTDTAVDALGNVYVVDQANNRIQKLSPTGQPLAQWGTEGYWPGEFANPESIALDRQGNIYVTDYDNNRIQKLSPDGKPLASWGDYGKGPGQFFGPQGIAIDAQGNIYVADTYNNRIQKLSPAGKSLAVWGTLGARSGQFNQPHSVAVDDSGSIYVSDELNNRIVKLAPNGHVVAQWGKFGVGPVDYYAPHGIALDRQGHLDVVDSGNNRIKVIAARDGQPDDTWGVFGTVPQILGRDTGIAVDTDGNVYIADESNSRIQIRSRTGQVTAVLGHRGVATGLGAAQVLGSFASPDGVAVDSLGYIYVADTGNHRIQVLSQNGPLTSWGGYLSTGPPFKFPRGLAVDRQDNLYVANSGANDILKLSPKGTLLATFGASDIGLDNPWGVAVDAAGNIYVADTGHNRIVKLSPTGHPLAAVGKLGYTALGQFSSPEGIAVDAQGNVYVADTYNSRIQKLSSDLSPIAAFGSTQSSLFANPVSLTVDAQGNLFVADTYNLRVVKLSNQGAVLATWE